MDNFYDVIIIGAGPAGMNAAMYASSQGQAPGGGCIFLLPVGAGGCK